MTYKRRIKLPPKTFTKTRPYIGNYNLDYAPHRPKLQNWLCVLHQFPLASYKDELLELLLEYHHTIVGDDGWTPDFNQENTDEARLSNVITQIKTLIQQDSTESASQERHGPSDARWLSPVIDTTDFIGWMTITREFYENQKHESK